MEATILHLGCDGGMITLTMLSVNGIFLFQIKTSEIFDEYIDKSATYLDIVDAWDAFKKRCPQWHQLYLVSITAPMIDILKTEYIAVTKKNEFTMDRWLQQLTGKDIGF